MGELYIYLVPQYLTFKISYVRFPVKCLYTSILHILMNNLVVVLLKSNKYEAFYRDFNKTFDFPVLLKWAIFYIDLVPQYLTFMISYVRFPVYLFIYKYSTCNNEQFGGCLTNAGVPLEPTGW